MPFSFLNPALLAGLAGAAVPLAAHLLGRRRGKLHRFAAMDFLLSSERRLAARRKVRNVLLLLTRMLLCGAVASLLARPSIERLPRADEPPVSMAVVPKDKSVRKVNFYHDKVLVKTIPIVTVY